VREGTVLVTGLSRGTWRPGMAVSCTRSYFRANKVTVGGKYGVCLHGAGEGVLQGNPSARTEGSRGFPPRWLRSRGQEVVWNGMWHWCPEWARGGSSLNVPWASCKSPTGCHPSHHMRLQCITRVSSGGGHWDPAVSCGFPWGFVLDTKPLIPQS